MEITHNTIDEIDTRVGEGLSIGYYGKDDNLLALPRMLGDWNIRTVMESRCPGTGYIVAVPSNSRTRKIYQQGRITWLLTIGFNLETAQHYIKASWSITRKWEYQVARFVLDNLQIDEYILNELVNSPNPKKAGRVHGIHTNSSRSMVLAACQILKNMPR